MSLTTTTITTTATATATAPISTPSLGTRTLPRSLRKFPSSSFGPGFGNSGIATASTPNLNTLFSSHSRLAPPAALSRKASFAALTPNSLATIPDATETYALHTLSESPSDKMAPLTPGRLRATAAAGGGGGADSNSGDDVAIGDLVDVPGNMYGTVRFIGTVAGRKGTFAGVELHPDHAARGKNSGDVDGVFYFTTSTPGTGIFVPLSKAVKRGAFPLTPTPSTGLKLGTQNSTNYTPPTPSIPKFGQSIGMGGGPPRAPSPQGKRSRTSLPRPDSPVRRLQMTPAPRPSIATPAPKTNARYGSPTSNKFSQSVRGPPGGDPSKRGLKPDRKTIVPPRSASALGQTSSSTTYTDDETTPVGIGRTKTNGSLSSVSSFSLRLRPASRAALTPADEEVERLRAQLEDRDRQLKDQASTLAEMESSLTELQTLIEDPEGPVGRRGSMDDKDGPALRALLREKNEKIAMLTAEFDAHRADFRSTIDTLEMASTETERVYEKKIEELMQEIHELENRTTDVDAVAQQLKQLEELVQELEEGLEDARRGEAEARGEVEFLRGEVERTRSELRREREKASASMNGGGAANGDKMLSISKELEQKEDEIRGLKAIIHSLSRDAVPGGVSNGPGESPEKTPTGRPGSWRAHRANESLGDRLAREKLEREVAELRGLLEKKSNREEEMEREIEQLRRGSVVLAPTSSSHQVQQQHRASSMTVGSTNRSSLRDSRGTVVLAREYESHSPETRKSHHIRGPTLDTMPESDAYSSVTESSTLWCEICETNGHDILTCTNMFGPQPEQQAKTEAAAAAAAKAAPAAGKDAAREGLKGLSPNVGQDGMTPRPLSPSPVKSKAPSAVPPEVKILPNPMDSGPVAGKESGVVDADKWCALCERDGHDSVDCPFEDAF